MKNLAKLCLLIVSLGSTLAFAAVTTSSPPNQQLAALLANFQTMQANFVQTLTVTGNKKLQQQTHGTMAIKRPGKFRWQIKKPTQQLIIADGNSLWIYDKDLAEATKQHLDLTQSGNPAMLLSGSVTDLEQDFIVSKLTKSESGIWFALKPKSQDGMFQEIELQFVDGKLESMQIVDNLGQNSLIAFSKVQINPQLASDIFQFVPPSGTDVIDN
ncbi:MAG: outer membrane lipoprotein chaperone LolA [Gammaproteobacteria bacterium]|nr:outer membrane lipoprotein chaperone LolA [Gammaproteobacteria bacterium]